MKWFKHDTNALSDVKLQAVLEKYGCRGIGFFWSLVEVCASENGLKVDTNRVDTKCLARRFNERDDAVNRLLDFFSELSLIDQDYWKEKRVIFMPALAKRADEWTSRKRSKEKELEEMAGYEYSRNSSVVPTESLQSNSSVASHNRTDTEEKRSRIEEIKEQLTLAWNGAGLPAIKKWSVTRKVNLARRLKDHEFEQNIPAIIQRIKDSSFLTGGGERHWRADIDWLLKNDTNYVKILEGKYDDANNRQRSRFVKKV